MKHLLRKLAGVPMAYSQRTGTRDGIEAEELPRDPEQLARLVKRFADVIQPVAAAPE